MMWLALLALIVAGVAAWSLRQQPRIAAGAAAFLLLAPMGLYAWLGQPETARLMREYENAGSLSEMYRRAVLKSGGDPALILAYNKALIAEAGGEVSDAAKKGLEMVLTLSPGEPEARYLLAIRTLQEGKTKQAMREMKALYHELPENHPLRALMDAQIGRK